MTTMNHTSAQSSSNTFHIMNKPTGQGLCDGIAGNFNSLAQLCFEFVDNSISNLRAHPDDDTLFRVVRIRLVEKCSHVNISVIDGGTGILDLDNALTLAGRGAVETPLNEHGFGLKHALSSVDSYSDQEWSIRTRTSEDALLDRYKEVSAPYDIEGLTGKYRFGSSDIANDTGTVISFRCPNRLFQTLKPATCRRKTGFEDLVGYLAEELSYTYTGVLERGDVGLEIIAIDRSGKEKRRAIHPAKINWVDGTRVEIGPVQADLGSGKVTIRCEYGTIRPLEGWKRYYQANMASSGVELRLNGRAIQRGLVSEIWGEALHPSRNGFLARIDVISDSGETLPATKSAKNAFREDDPRLEKLFAWIRSNVRKPERDPESKEHKMVRRLAEELSRDPEVLRVSQEEGVYQSIGLKSKIDLFVSFQTKVRIYEAKVHSTRALDLYQLRMYWDGCALDGKPVTEAVLMAGHHSREVRTLLAQLNTQCDPTGAPYHFFLGTWPWLELDRADRAV